MSDPALFSALEERLGVHFTDRDLLQQVFIHRSYLNEHKNFPLDHNERLEFLGDAVLELVVTDYLYRNFPNPEGELTIWRSSLVKGDTLAEVARDLAIPDYLQVSRGEEKSGGKEKSYLLANALEALIGATYLDQGYDSAKHVIEGFILSRLPAILEQKLYIDPKSRLQELTQEKFGFTPQYSVVDQVGPDHAKEFTVTVSIQDREIGRGVGASKQSAQVAAAAEALRALQPEA